MPAEMVIVLLFAPYGLGALSGVLLSETVASKIVCAGFVVLVAVLMILLAIDAGRVVGMRQMADAEARRRGEL